ncbi:hypothetical protein CPB85DRAFT_1427971 [Mucidula mucida]|nr:hypothetical protein CPB85DRAFT_1427971 [Mucidula mucida]
MLLRARLVVAAARWRVPILARHAQSLSKPAVRVPDHNANIFNDTLQQIQLSLSKRDLPAVLEFWKTLKERDLHRLLSSTYLARISVLLVEEILPKNPRDDLPAPHRDVFEQIALASAASKSPAALEALLRYHLARRELDTIISLHDQFRSISEAPIENDGVEQDEDSEDSEQDFYAYQQSNYNTSSPSTVSEINIALITTTAYLLHHKDFKGAVGVIRNAPRLHHYTVKEFLSKIDDEDLRASLDSWLTRLQYARMLDRPKSYAIHLRKMGSSKNVSALVIHYNAMVDGIDGPDPYIAADPSRINEKRLVAMNERLWTAFLSAFLAAGVRERAEHLWVDLGRFRVPHTAPMWNALIDAFREQGQTESAYQTYLQMQKEGVKPGPLTYRAIIAALMIDKRRLDMAWRLFKEFQDKLQPHVESIHAIPVYNSYLQGLLNHGMLEQALDIFDFLETNLKEQRPAPRLDIVTFNMLMSYFARRSDLKNVSLLLNKLVELSLTPDVFTFSVMMSALIKAGNMDATERVFRLMESMGIQPTMVTYATIIVELLREREDKFLAEALKILDSMEGKGNDLSPNLMVYEAFLVELWRVPWLPIDQGAMIVADILSRTKRRRMSISLNMFSLIIRVALTEGYPDGVELAWKLYKELGKHKYRIPAKLLLVLLEGMIQHGEVGNALQICSEINKAGMKQSVTLSNLFRQVDMMRRARGRVPKHP